MVKKRLIRSINKASNIGVRKPSHFSRGKSQKQSVTSPHNIQTEQKKKRFSLVKRIFSGILVLIFFAFCGLLYAATIKGVPGNPDAAGIKRLEKATQPFELSPERGRYAHTYALAEKGSFSLSPDLADAVYPDVGYVDGRFYSFFAPGVSFFAVPFYKIGSLFNLAQVATFGAISLFALGSIFFLYRIARDIFHLSTLTSLLPGILFAFSSTSWSYATTMYQHHVTTFFILSSFYAVWKYGHKGKLSFLWAAYVWFSYAAAFMVDYPNLVFMLPVMVYFFLTSFSVEKIRQRLTISARPAFFLTAVIFFILTAVHGYYNQTQFGSWKQLAGTIVGYKAIKEQQLFEKNDGKETLKALEESKTTTSFFREERLPHGLYTLILAPDKGILIFSPIFALGIAAIIGLRNRFNTPLAILLSLSGLNLFLYASFGDPWGGWAYGPRYLILSMAVLSLFITLWAATSNHRIVTKIILFLLFAYSSAIALMGVLTTNAAPPKVEADFLHMKYGIFLAYEYFKSGGSSSFLYNTVFSSLMSLQQYFMTLYGALLAVFLVILAFGKGGTTDDH